MIIIGLYNNYFIKMSDKNKWIEPQVKELGDILDLTQGGEGGDPKFIGAGDQFAVNDLST